MNQKTLEVTGCTHCPLRSYTGYEYCEIDPKIQLADKDGEIPPLCPLREQQYVVHLKK